MKPRACRNTRTFCILAFLWMIGRLFVPSSAAEQIQGTALSLRVLQEQLRSMPRGTPIPEHIQHFGGITRLEGYVVDRDHHDVILVGSVGESDSLPPVLLDDFVVALRNAWMVYAEKDTVGNRITITYEHPGCSIDPRPETIKKLQEVGDRIMSNSTAGLVEEEIKDWHRVCKDSQDVRIMGVPFDSRFSRVMVKADYDMKCLANGSDPLAIPGFLSLSDLTMERVRAAVLEGRPIDVSVSTLDRFWFHSGEFAHTASQGAGRIDAMPVILLTEAEHLSNEGTLRGTGYASPLAKAFSDSFSSHYGEIAEERPIYRDLENLYRHVLIAKLLEYFDDNDVTQSDLQYLLSGYSIGTRRVARKLPGRSNVKEFRHREDYAGGYSEVFFWLPSCGGVVIDLTIRPPRYGPGESEGLDLWREEVLKARPGTEDFQWEVFLMDMGQLDGLEALLRWYALNAYLPESSPN